MGKEIKRITAKEFMELGLLQEVNRQLLHPMGLALEVVIEDNGDVHFGEVQDVRDDPEGMAFCKATDDATKIERSGKAKKVQEMFEAKRAVREKNLGWHIQPIND